MPDNESGILRFSFGIVRSAYSWQLFAGKHIYHTRTTDSRFHNHSAGMIDNNLPDYNSIFSKRIRADLLQALL
jgi:hypothetical protein